MEVTSTARWTHAAPILSADVEIAHLPAVEPPENRTDFVDRNLRQLLTARSGPVFMLVRDAFRNIDSDGARAVFIQEPLSDNEDGLRVGFLSSTRERSIHEVRFGQLVIQDTDNRESVELVAVKPLDTAGRAINEFRAMQHINTLPNPEGRSRGFQQLGFYRDISRGRTFVLSQYEHSVLSYDNLLWDEQYIPTEVELKAAMGHCAVLLGDMHAAGIMHGDPQAKNMARDNLGPRVVDLESAQKPKEMSDGRLDSTAAFPMIRHDLKYISEDFEPWSELAREYFVKPYLDRVHGQDSRIDGFAVPTQAELLKYFEPES